MKNVTAFFDQRTRWLSPVGLTEEARILSKSDYGLAGVRAKGGGSWSISALQGMPNIVMTRVRILLAEHKVTHVTSSPISQRYQIPTPHVRNIRTNLQFETRCPNWIIQSETYYLQHLIRIKTRDEAPDLPSSLRTRPEYTVLVQPHEFPLYTPPFPIILLQTTGRMQRCISDISISKKAKVIERALEATQYFSRRTWTLWNVMSIFPAGIIRPGDWFLEDLERHRVCFSLR